MPGDAGNPGHGSRDQGMGNFCARTSEPRQENQGRMDAAPHETGHYGPTYSR
jgi:hypothetical protein